MSKQPSLFDLYPSIESLKVDGFGFRLAGIAESEGCFYISSTKLSNARKPKPVFKVNLRDDDADIVRTIQCRTGVGTVHSARGRGRSQPQMVWDVQRQSHCEQLVKIFTAFPLLAKKRRDFWIWSQAVFWRSQIVVGCRAKSKNGEHQKRIERLAHQLNQIRKYVPPIFVAAQWGEPPYSEQLRWHTIISQPWERAFT